MTRAPTGPPPPPPPRPFSAVLPRALDLIAWIGFGLLAVLGGGLLTAGFVPYLIDHALLDERGVQATGKAENVVFYFQGKSRFHRIDVRFRDRSGREHIAELRTQEPAFIARGEAKGEFQLTYDPEDPSRYRFAGEVRLPWIVGLTPFLIALGGLIAMAVGLLRFPRRHALVARGHVSQGVVARVDRIAASKSKGVVYQFFTPQGPCYGQSTTRKPPAVGTGVWVVYDPRAPERSVVW